MTTPPFDAPTAADIAVVSAQLGRPARNVLGISARCVCGAPTVVATAPRLSHGEPFPTLYYLSHPAATAAISHLEAEHVMGEFQDALVTDPELADAYRAAHLAYLADRDGIEAVPELSGISAGGMPTRVKCLHALAAHSLSAGPGVNPVGDLALARATWTPRVCQCADYGIEGDFGVGAAGGAGLGGDAQPDGGARPDGNAQPDGDARPDGEVKPNGGAQSSADPRPAGGARPGGDARVDRGAR